MVRKNNYGPTGAVLHLAFDGAQFMVEQPPAKDAKAKVTARDSIGLAALRQTLLDPAVEHSPSLPAVPPGVQVTTVEAWRTAASAMGITPSPSPAAKRQAVGRIREALIGVGLVHVAEPFA